MPKRNTRKLSQKEQVEVEGLLVKHYPFIRRMAIKLHNISKIPLEDLAQEGCLGLMRAYETYDKTKAGFLTYAKFWIRTGMMSYIHRNQHMMRIPGEYFTIMSKVRDIATLPVKKMARELKVTEERLSRIIDTLTTARTAIELDALPDTIAPEMTDPYDTLLTKNSDKEFIAKVRATVTKQELFVLMYNLGIGPYPKKTLTWIGKIMGITKERTRQIRNKALEKLRNELTDTSRLRA